MGENHEDINETAFWGTFGIVGAALFGLGILALSLFLSAKTAPARTLYPGQWAQVDPKERAWFKAQRSPNGVPCCDESDGTYAEESLTPPEGAQTSDGRPHYWARFTWKRCLYNGAVVAPSYLPSGSLADCEDVVSGWMEVPDEVVIHDPNRHGAPVVWWAVDGAKVRMRCYAPGGGV